MALKLQNTRRSRLSMTSLIDVIFLLLLFFMLTSTFAKYGEIELMAAGAGRPADGRQMLFVTLGENRLELNGQPADMARIAGLIGMQPQDGGGHLVLVSPDDSASAQRLAELLAALRAVAGLQVAVLG